MKKALISCMLILCAASLGCDETKVMGALDPKAGQPAQQQQEQKKQQEQKDKQEKKGISITLTGMSVGSDQGGSN